MSRLYIPSYELVLDFNEQAFRITEQTGKKISAFVFENIDHQMLEN